MFKYLFIITLFISTSSIADDELTLKQQFDRLQRDVNDISKLVYKGGSSNNDQNSQNELSSFANLSAFDMRIYDIESDIKIINSNIEDLIFKIDEIKNSYDQLIIRLDSKSINSDSENNYDQDIIEKENDNNLGTFIINSEDLSDGSGILNEDRNQNNIEDLTIEEKFQAAYDLLRSQKFDKAEQSLSNFISDHPENELSGSAHYWLGEIYLLRKQYVEAALIFAEGYQKHPRSVKSPDSLFKLANTLSKIEKIEDSCNYFKKFVNELPDHKLKIKAEEKIASLGCN